MPRPLVTLIALLVAIHFSYGHASSFEEDGSVWRFMPVHYCINPAGLPVNAGKQPLFTQEQFVDMVQAAFQTWEDLPSSEIKFAYDGICKNLPTPGDKVNVIGWRNLGRIPASGAAVDNDSAGKYLRGGASYEKLEADIILNSRVDFYKNLDEYLNEILPSTILHEIGHFIGLGHSDAQPCAVMTEEAIFPTELCQDDIDGAARLYP